MPDERAYKRAILLLMILLGAVIGLLIALLLRYRELGAYAPLAEMAATIEKNYYYYDEEGGEPALIDASLRGMVASIDDPYAQYFTKEEYDELLTSQSGEYTGIGIVVVEPDATGTLIQHVYPGSPMADAGARDGDYILEINGSSAANISMDEMLALFSQDDSTPDELVLLREGRRFSISVRRSAVYVPYVHYEMLDGTIGYIHIDAFLGNVASEMDEALDALIGDGMTALVLDLRGNPGGGLTEVLDVADLFLQKGDAIVSIKSKVEKTKDYYAEDNGYGFPMVVLVNGNSASAAELLTGALQDNGRAAVIGTQTFGKGIVQTYFRLNANAGWVKITTDAYYTPNDVSIHGVGITPDIVVQLPEELQMRPISDLSREQDLQLLEAIKHLNG